MTIGVGSGGPQWLTSLLGANRTFDPADTAALEDGGEIPPSAPPEAASTPARRRGPSARRRGPDAAARYSRARLERGLADESPTPTIPTGVLEPGQLGPVPQQGGEAIAPGAGGKGGLFTEEAETAARNIIAGVSAPDADHVHARYKADLRQDLEQLGLLGEGTGRIHIDDVDIPHGASVLRTAAGPLSLAEGADATLHTFGAPPELVAERRTPAQAERLGDLDARVRAAGAGELGSDAVVELMGDRLESVLLSHGDAVAHVRDQLPDDGRDTFMNMSWGLSAEEALMQGSVGMLTAPPGSAAYEEVTELLGHPPTPPAPMDGGGRKLDEGELETVRRHLEGKLDTLHSSDEFQGRMATAREAFETELAAGRAQGLLVFASAGNDAGSADHYGRPDLAENVASGTEGLILVGATHVHDAPGTDDDRVAGFSSPGDVTISAPGTQIPVGTPASDLGPNPFRRFLGGPDQAASDPAGAAPLGAPVDVDGTSFSSPAAVEAAYLADQIDPSLSVNDIEALLTDPRVLHDIEGTARDGAGQIDPFAVALLARNRDLSRAEIDAARVVMQGEPSADEIAALRARLGL